MSLGKKQRRIIFEFDRVRVKKTLPPTTNGGSVSRIRSTDDPPAAHLIHGLKEPFSRHLAVRRQYTLFGRLFWPRVGDARAWAETKRRYVLFLNHVCSSVYRASPGVCEASDSPYCSAQSTSVLMMQRRIKVVYALLVIHKLFTNLSLPEAFLFLAEAVDLSIFNGSKEGILWQGVVREFSELP